MEFRKGNAHSEGKIVVDNKSEKIGTIINVLVTPNANLRNFTYFTKLLKLIFQSFLNKIESFTIPAHFLFYARSKMQQIWIL